MQTTIVSSKGQVIIPKASRVARHWGPGTQLEVHDTPEGLLLRPMPQVEKVSLSEGLASIRRNLAYRGPTVTLQEMDAEVLRQAASRMSPPAATPVAPDARKAPAASSTSRKRDR